MMGFHAARSEARLYVASRATQRNADFWRSLRDVQGWRIISSWIDEAGPGETADMTALWLRIDAEIRTADGLIFLAFTGDAPWKGAMVEAGMALARDLPVAVVDPSRDSSLRRAEIGSWLAHPRVTLHKDVYGAREAIEVARDRR